VPLLPTVAGIGALGIVLAAYGTQQISLNFADGAAPPQPGQGTQRQPTSQAQARAQAQRPDPAAQGAHARGAQPNRGSGQPVVMISFRATSKWASGFQGSATIVNVSDRPINGWSLAFRFPNAQVMSVWDVALVKAGSPVVVHNPPQSPTIVPGESLHIGFTARGAVSAPSACTFNGVRCRVV
jgi:hypothetical protein